MNWQLMISLRYLFERRKERFISVTSFISVMGIVVGVAALIVTMGIMNGFNNEIKEKILSVNPHVIVISDIPIKNPDELEKTLTGISGVIATERLIDGQALIGIRDNMMGILLRGVDDNPRMRLTKMERFLAAGSLELGAGSAIVGSELARHFMLNLGDRVSIISPVSGKSTEFKIKGIFNSGRYDYDLNLVFVGLKDAAKVLGKESSVTGIGLMTEDAFEADAVKRRINSILGPPYWALGWKDIDKNLFSALKLEKIVMFMLVTLIVFVACFNIISTLIMTVMEKTRDIGILRAIGVTRFGIMSLFFLEGLFISAIGITSGAAVGLGLCWLQSKYELVKLPPDVYYIYSVPIQVRIPDTLIIIGAAFALGMLAAVYPSMHAAQLNPVDALKYE